MQSRLICRLQGAMSFTLCVWARIEQASNPTASFISWGGGNATLDFGRNLFGRCGPGCYQSNFGGIATPFTASAAVTEAGWNHYAVTVCSFFFPLIITHLCMSQYDRASGMQVIYVNGIAA